MTEEQVRVSDGTCLSYQPCSTKCPNHTLACQVPIWGTDLGAEQIAAGQARTGDMSDVFAVLSFGLPTLARMADGRVLMAFWCARAARGVAWRGRAVKGRASTGARRTASPISAPTRSAARPSRTDEVKGFAVVVLWGLLVPSPTDDRR